MYLPEIYVLNSNDHVIRYKNTFNYHNPSYKGKTRNSVINN